MGFSWSLGRQSKKAKPSSPKTDKSSAPCIVLETPMPFTPTKTREGEEDDSMTLITSASSRQRSDSERSYFLAKLLSEDEYDEEGEPSVPSKHVHFGVAQVQEYTQVLGDHPFCSLGCPLELGWTPQSCQEWSVEEYESTQRFSYHTSMAQLKLTPEERRAMLEDNEAISEQEIRKACRRRNRNRSEACLGQRKLQKEFFC